MSLNTSIEDSRYEVFIVFDWQLKRVLSGPEIVASLGHRREQAT